jgi:FkbM family methyltransferase
MFIKEFVFRGKTYKIACLDDTPQHASWYTFEDESHIREVHWHILPGDTILDVGAAYGSYVITALSQGASYVWAWSPQGEVGEKSEAEMLRKTLALNGWSDKCCIIKSGVYDRVGWLHTMTQEFFVFDPRNGSDQDSYVIPVSTLDSWMSSVNLLRVDWMKLDVEGAEVEVLKGAKNLISKFHPKVQVENHVFKRASIYQEVCDLLVKGEFGVKYNEISTIQCGSISHSLYFPIN